MFFMAMAIFGSYNFQIRKFVRSGEGGRGIMIGPALISALFAFFVAKF